MTTMRLRLGLVVLLAGAAGALVAAQGMASQSRDAVKKPLAPGRGSIGGSVMSEQSPATPIGRATVTITTADGDPAALAFTDARGAFLAPRLPAGRYIVVATKPAYVRAPYGAKHYDRPGTPITLGDGQALTGVNMTMSRGGVLSGTVTDDGAPIPDVMVRVSQYRTIDGQRVLAPVPQAGSPTSTMTDDRGGYRIFGLPAGEYVISASPRQMAGGDIRQMTPADIQSVRQVLQAANAANTAGARPPDAVTVTYASVYYPSTTVAADATTVGLNPGEERTGLDMAMQLVRTAHVDGMVVTPPGVPPQSVQLLLLPNGGGNAGIGGLISINRVAVGPDGTFSYTGVAPGQYTLSARATVQGGNGANANAGAGRGLPPVASVPPGGSGPQLWGQADVSVSGANISGVSITLQPGMTISGRVVADPGTTAAPDLSRARISLTPAASANGIMIGVSAANVESNGRFTIAGVVPGKYRISAALPGAAGETPWTPKSATLSGHDAIDVPFEVVPNQNITDGVVTFTTQTQEVSGKLQDASGRPATEFTVVLFPTDRAAWTSTRRVRTARPATDGHFAFPNVPAGDYRLAAVVDVAPNEVTDPAFLSEVSAASIAVTLRDGEKKTQDIRLAGGG